MFDSDGEWPRADIQLVSHRGLGNAEFALRACLSALNQLPDMRFGEGDSCTPESVYVVLPQFSVVQQGVMDRAVVPVRVMEPFLSDMFAFRDSMVDAGACWADGTCMFLAAYLKAVIRTFKGTLRTHVHSTFTQLIAILERFVAGQSTASRCKSFQERADEMFSILNDCISTCGQEMNVEQPPAAALQYLLRRTMRASSMSDLEDLPRLASVVVKRAEQWGWWAPVITADLKKCCEASDTFSVSAWQECFFKACLQCLVSPGITKVLALHEAAALGAYALPVPAAELSAFELPVPAALAVPTDLSLSPISSPFDVDRWLNDFSDDDESMLLTPWPESPFVIPSRKVPTESGKLPSLGSIFRGSDIADAMKRAGASLLPTAGGRAKRLDRASPSSASMTSSMGSSISMSPHSSDIDIEMEPSLGWTFGGTATSVDGGDDLCSSSSGSNHSYYDESSGSNSSSFGGEDEGEDGESSMDDQGQGESQAEDDGEDKGESDDESESQGEGESQGEDKGESEDESESESEDESEDESKGDGDSNSHSDGEDEDKDQGSDY